VVKDKGLPLDSYCYTAAIEACVWQQALKLLNEMEEKGIEPSEVTYSITIKACGAGGQWRKALDLLESMRSKKLPINLYVYNAAITAVSKAAKQLSKSGYSDGQLWMEVIALLGHMRQDGIEPDGFSFSSAISCCGSEGRWEEALDLIEVMTKGGPKTRPNKICYTAAISSCGRAGQVDHALRLFDQMKEQGLAADRVAYNALFSALRVSKRAEAAFALWDEMLGHPLTLSRTSKIATARISTSPDIITVTE
jgi:pentatricopeptide repeat domain-containing protein 1